VSTRQFYDALAPWYHVIFPDWDASMERQGAMLDTLIEQEWGPKRKSIADLAAGVGTQAIPLRRRGHQVVAADLARRAVKRALTEAAGRGLRLTGACGDFTAVPLRDGSVDLVIACDNSLPHLHDEAAILTALREFHRCIRPGGGCLLTMRDYGPPPPAGTREVRPYGEHPLGDRTLQACQVWHWRGAHYDLTLEIVDVGNGSVVFSHSATYFAISPGRMLALLEAAGFAAVRRIDDGFYQPVLVGSRPAGSH
jgi:SAM-dependent methyltransferase